VTGTHTYAADGSYAVQVTVVDQYGDTLSTTGTVSVVRDPLAAYGNMVEATAGLALNNVLLGVFTDPDAEDQSGEYTVLINWGDGTAPTVGTIIGGNGLFEVLGSHTYANAGEYVPMVQVEWGDPVDVLNFLLMAAAQAPSATEIVPGWAAPPKNVPGNSEYQFAFRFTKPMSPADWEKYVSDYKWDTGSPNAIPVEKTIFGLYEQKGTNPRKLLEVNGVLARVAFKNVPATYTLTVQWNNGTAVQKESWNVNVVKVTVTTPKDAFTPGKPSQAMVPRAQDEAPQALIQDKKFRFQGKGELTLPTTFLYIGQTKTNVKLPTPEDSNLYKVNITTPALAWKAGVELTAPKDTNAASSIVVGSIQHGKETKHSITIPTIGTRQWMPGVLGKEYLDASAGSVPWTHGDEVALVKGNTTPRGKTIQDDDTPYAGFPLAADPPPGRDSIAYATTFTLDVAAMTLDAKGSYWQEAYAVQSNETLGWSYDASGTLAPAPGYVWSGDVRQPILSPKDWKETLWKAPGPGMAPEPIQENVKGPTFNQAIDSPKFEWETKK
jgi:PKD repeat protein